MLRELEGTACDGSGADDGSGDDRNECEYFCHVTKRPDHRSGEMACFFDPKLDNSLAVGKVVICDRRFTNAPQDSTAKGEQPTGPSPQAFLGGP